MKNIFFRITFFIFFNIFLFLTITLNIYYLLPALNFLVMFFLYELYLLKRDYNQNFEKFKNSNKEIDLNIDRTPASEHPLIKAAKQRLKN